MMSDHFVRIGTRGSKLAMWQAEYVKKLLIDRDQTLAVEIVPIKTTGDIIQDVALARLEGKAFFTKEIEDALLNGDVDVAVHSGKDVPTEQPPGLTLSGFLKRHSPYDAWISKSGATMTELGAGSTVGTSSLRRRALLASLRPELVIKDLRGNVNTRLRKLKEGQYDAVILAGAGLERLGMIDEITELLDSTRFPPAVAQGAIALEQRKDDSYCTTLLKDIVDQETTVAARAERALLSTLEGGCQVPLGALSTIKNGQLTLLASLLSLNGKRRIDGSLIGRSDQPERLGRQMAEHLLAQGGDQILSDIRQGGIKETASVCEGENSF